MLDTEGIALENDVVTYQNLMWVLYAEDIFKENHFTSLSSRSTSALGKHERIQG